MKIALILALLLMTIVSAVSDTTPPILVSFDFEPKIVDVSKSDQNITLTLQLNDDLSGIADVPGHYHRLLFGPIFRSPLRKQSLNVIFGEDNRVSGDLLNGTYILN